MINAIAIDDEPIALDILSRHAEKVEFIDLKKTFTSASAALAYVAAEPVQLVFLDINMPDISGLELAGLLGPDVSIVFTTAHMEYAVNGFDLAITDFLLKPINYSRFLQACVLAQKRIGVTGNQPIKEADGLFVKDGYDWVKINFNDLLYVKAEDNYSSLFEKDKRIMTRMTLQELLQKLPGNFVRVHKSYVVNVAAIEKLESYQLTINGIKIPVSKPFRETLKSKVIG